MDLSPQNVKNKFFGIWQSSDSTGQKVARGGFIVFFERFIVKGIYFIRTVILARLLFPDDFGLFGLATLTMTFTEVFFQPGFSSAIVQEKGDVKKYLNSAWTFNLLRNIFLALLLFFVVAPLAGNFFHNSDAVPLTRALAIIFVILGFENIGVALFQRNLELNRQFFYRITGITFEIIVVIISAFILRNAWALVLGAIANRFASVIASYIFHPYRPRLTFDFSGARHLFKFGKWIGASGVVMLFVSQGDNLMIGRLLDAQALGFYQLAFALGMLPANEIGRALGNLLFPVYSKIQNDQERLKIAFIRIARIVFAVIIPAAFGLVALAHSIVNFVYGERWLPMVPILYVIVVCGLLKAFDYIANPLLLGTGKVKTTTFILIIQAVVMFSLVVPLTKLYGSVGTAWSVFSGLAIAEIIILFKLKKQLNISLWIILKMLFLPLVAGALMFFAIRFFKGYIAADNVLMLILYIAFGMAVYFLGLFLLDKIFGRRFYESLIWIKQNI
ncbi:MAG: lipopolysaccharide biosynthesis protein [Candidatus Portnoybacteria bacterium]|nr:lipopolysaccharide biosynthesis protein [Candidatus Portnoybacteria bacterium]